MPKLKSRKHKVLDPLESDESFEDEEIEEGLIKDSVLQLASDRYDDFDPDEFAGSKLRNINAPQTDLAAEYKGISISRKKIANENSSDDDIDASDDEKDDDRSADDNENEENDASLSDGIETESSKEEEEGDDAVSDEDMSSCDEPSKTKGNKEKENGYSVYSKKSLDVHEDIEKGNAIRQQYEIWENLLECRIKLQKCLSATNKLPQNDNFSQLVSKLPRTDQNKISKTVKNLCGTLRTLIDLQMSLMSSQPEFSASSKLSEKRDLSSKSIDEDDAAGDADEDDDISISSSIASGFSEHQVGNAEKDEDVEKGDDDDVENDDVDEPPAKKLRKLDDFSRELNKQHTVYLSARNAAIQKWNDKTRVSSGKISSANFSAFDQSTLKQIEQILCDKERLIKRTQTKRSLYCALDPNKDATKFDQDNKKEILAEFDEEIFDDDDFYHKLLRDLIDQRSSDITDPSKMGRQWVELQKARSKMKRNIDVKSTKGRRLRYTVHQKLVNFMAPIPYNSYTDEAESELFNSLFGKLKQ